MKAKSVTLEKEIPPKSNDFGGILVGV